jgi:hypothetical protein
MPLLPKKWTPRSSRSTSAGTSRETSPNILSWASTLLQSTPKDQAAVTRITKKETPSRGSSLEVPSPTAYPRKGQRHQWPGLPHPTASAFRFSQPLDAFIRPMPAGLVSCRIRSWGSPFRAFLLSHSRKPSPESSTLMPLEKHIGLHSHPPRAVAAT